jgi:hypothetical protein
MRLLKPVWSSGRLSPGASRAFHSLEPPLRVGDRCVFPTRTTTGWQDAPTRFTPLAFGRRVGQESGCGPLSGRQPALTFTTTSPSVTVPGSPSQRDGSAWCWALPREAILDAGARTYSGANHGKLCGQARSNRRRPGGAGGGGAGSPAPRRPHRTFAPGARAPELAGAAPRSSPQGPGVRPRIEA